MTGVSEMGEITMSVFYIFFLFLGASLGKEQIGLFEPSALKQHVINWAEEIAGKAVVDLKELVAQLEHVIEMANDPHVQKLAQLYQENIHFLHRCEFAAELGHELDSFNSCVNITYDIASATAICYNAWELVDCMGSKVYLVCQELNTCGEESVWKQFSCYKSAFSDMRDYMKEYSSQCNELLANTTIEFNDISVDIKNCLSFSEKYSSSWIESNIKSCKLDLEQKLLL